MEDKVRIKFDVNIQNSTLRFARNSTSALPTIQHSKLKTQHSKRYAANFIIRRLRQTPMAS